MQVNFQKAANIFEGLGRESKDDPEKKQRYEGLKELARGLLRMADEVEKIKRAVE